MFPDDFPFKRRDAEDAEAQAPVVEAQPLVLDASVAPATRDEGSSIFPAGFPFVESPPVSPEVEEVAPAMTQATADPVSALVAAPAPAEAPAPLPFKDRRRSPRQRMHAKATLRVDTIGGNPLAVEIDNLSLLGVRFRAGRELLINDKANIRLEVGPLKWNARLRVINCLRHDAASYTIGCEFVGNELARGRAAA